MDYSTNRDNGQHAGTYAQTLAQDAVEASSQSGENNPLRLGFR
jgi:hypothetical protein